MFNQKSILNINVLKLKNMQNNNKNKLLSTSFCQEIRHVIIDDYKTINDEHANVNNQSFI